MLWVLITLWAHQCMLSAQYVFDNDKNLFWHYLVVTLAERTAP